MAQEWLDTTHPVYDANEALWRKNERRMFGGDAVLDELRPFQWEEKGGDHHEDRKAEAAYLNFPALLAESVVGHLFREAPVADENLSFGNLGEVSQPEGEEPSQAAQVHKNADGIGNDASQWDAWWSAVERRAMATGHRWLMVEATPEAPANREQELGGLRPYLVEFSPLAVTNWYYRRGQLQFAIVRIRDRQPTITEDGSTLDRNDREKGYLLLVREGYQGLGEDYVGGGWWKYDPDRDLVDNGSWELTDGEIPLWPHYYERSTGTDELEAISRPATTELGQIAVALMNLNSAANFDAWDAAASVIYATGVDKDGLEAAQDQYNDGSKIVGLPVNQDTHEPPQIHDGSVGAVVAEVFARRTEAMIEQAEKIATQEASGEPGSSGRSKQLGFADVKAPRLAQMASEIENSQNIALHFLERRFGVDQPSGSVTWTREFDLTPLVDEIEGLFELEALAGVRSPTVAARGMTAAVRDRGLVTEEEEIEGVEDEYRQSAEDRARDTRRRVSFRERVDEALGTSSGEGGEGG